MAKSKTTTSKGKSLITPIFRVSFPNVFEARSMDDGPAKFGLMAVWEPAKFSAKEKERWQAMQKLANEVSMGKFKKLVKDLPDNYKKPIRKGEEKEDLAGFGPGKVFSSLTTKFKPGVVDKDGKTKIVDDEDAIYPGCYARATVTCYAYDNKGKGLAFGLMNLQKIADGARLDSRTDAEDDFENEDLSAEDEKWLAEQEGVSFDEDDGGFGDDDIAF